MRIAALAVVGMLVGCGGSGGTGGSGGGDGGGSGGGSGGSGGGTAACSSSNCTGCCLNGTCNAGSTAAGCGKNGAACAACNAVQICKTDQTCGVDPEANWVVQAVSATIAPNDNGTAWDGDNSAPDVVVRLFCPSGSATAVSSAEVQSYMPTWSTGSCTMKAKDLMATGFDFQVFDIDAIVDDTITAKLGPNKATESTFASGGLMLTTATGGLQAMKINLTKQ